MAWTAPMTAVAGSVWTAAQWNTSVRDNLNATETGSAQTVSGYSVVTGVNQVTERVPVGSFLLTLDTTTSTSYTDMETTPGPAVTAITGTRAYVSIAATVRSTGGTAAWMGYEISGETSRQADDTHAIEFQVTDPDNWSGGSMFLETGLTPGTNTFTAKYRVTTSGTARIDARSLFVLPF